MEMVNAPNWSTLQTNCCPNSQGGSVQLLVCLGADPSCKSPRYKTDQKQLRREVSAQRETIEELKAMVEQLVEVNARATPSSSVPIHVSGRLCFGGNQSAELPASRGGQELALSPSYRSRGM